jgi:hypothetical protein
MATTIATAVVKQDANIILNPSPTSLFTIRALVLPSVRTNIQQQVSVYDKFGSLFETFTIQTSSLLMFEKVNFSEITFREQTDNTYEIFLTFIFYEYNNEMQYKINEKKANVRIIPILFGPVGI